MPEAYNGGPLSHVPPAKIELLCAEAARTPPGCFVEFGVYKGGSAWHLARVAREQGRKLYLFDTFKGMPFQDDGDRISAGAFAETSADEVRALIPDAILCVGVFPATMPADMPLIAFAHIDCDQQRSVRDAWHRFSPLMVKGGTMIFDDVLVLNPVHVVFDELVGNRLHAEADAGLVRF